MCDTPNRPVRNTPLLPIGHWRMAAFHRKMGNVKHIKHWKPSRGAPMRYFGTNNCLLIYALCLILATGHWGTPHYYQLATEEWLHFTARWWTWNTLNIENHLGWPRWVIFDYIIQSRCLSYSGDSQPASEERPINLKRPLKNGDCMGRQGTLNIENRV